MTSSYFKLVGQESRDIPGINCPDTTLNIPIVSYYESDLKTIRSITYHDFHHHENLNVNMSRMDIPTCQQLWCIHRVNGPATIEFYRNGVVKCEKWYIQSRLWNRKSYPKQMPSIINYNESGECYNAESIQNDQDFKTVYTEEELKEFKPSISINNLPKYQSINFDKLCIKHSNQLSFDNFNNFHYCCYGYNLL